jgi:hypothetical protein
VVPYLPAHNVQRLCIHQRMVRADMLLPQTRHPRRVRWLHIRMQQVSHTALIGMLRPSAGRTADRVRDCMGSSVLTSHLAAGRSMLGILRKLLGSAF